MKREIKFGKMLDFFRQEKNMTMEELGAYLGRNKSTVSRWISGERYPKIEEVEQIVNFFDTDVETLLFGANKIDAKNSVLYLINETSSQLTPPRQQKVYDFVESQLKEQKCETKQKNNPLTSLEQFRKKKEEETIYGTTKWCGPVSAGTGEFLTDETCEEIELPIEQIPTEADFCLSVNGDSMEPTFHNGEYVFVKKQLDIFSGKIGVAILNGEAFLKRIWFENGDVKLESLNKKYKDIIVTENDEFRIIGKVVM